VTGDGLPPAKSDAGQADGQDGTFLQQPATSERTQLLVKDLENLQRETLHLKNKWLDFNSHFIKVSAVRCLFC
jgi:hypothetical protein